MALSLNLKNLFKMLFCILTIWSCGNKNSLNTPSYSDNKTFIANKYNKKKPISPFGNLSNDKNEQDIGIKYYQDYIDTGMYNLYQNQEYMEWVTQKRLERLQKGKLNGFKNESVPGDNFYYIQKTKSTKGKRILLNEKIYLDVNTQIQYTINKNKTKEIKQEKTEIDDYIIQNNSEIGTTRKAINESDY